MARHFQTPPIFSEPCVAQTVDVWSAYYQAAGAWPEPFPTLPQQINRVYDVFDHMTEGNYIVLLTFGQIRYCTKLDVKPLAPTVGNSCGIGIDTKNLPTKGTHLSNEFAISATHIEETSSAGRRQGKHAEHGRTFGEGQV
jgi:hypothetical protein